jgi:imidazolonepropionase-like amidohydrolase
MVQEDVSRFKELLARMRDLVKRLQAEGAAIVAGTDVGSPPYVYPGFSLHDELAALVQAGMSPLASLQAATLNPATMLNRDSVLGTIEPGKLADAVLLEGNPIDDIRNTQRIRAVIAGGHVFGRSDLDNLLLDA